MEKRQNKLLIGGLIAVIFLMAVGYAAFATQLSVDGAAGISSTWNVHFDPSKTTGPGVLDITVGRVAGGEVSSLQPVGTINYTNNNFTANLGADLKQPGDKIVFTLTIMNEGNLKAAPGQPIISIVGSDATPVDNHDGTYTITKDHIQYTVINPTRTLSQNGTDNVIVEAEFVDTNPAVAAHCSDPTYQTQSACETAGQSDDTIRWIPATKGTTSSLTTAEASVLRVTVLYTQPSS